MTRLSRRLAFALSLVFASFAAGRAAELKGRFVIEGELPTVKLIENPRAAESLPGVKIIDEKLVVDPKSRGIADVLVYVRPMADMPEVPITEDALGASMPRQVVEIKEGRMQPHVSGIWFEKQKLVFKNSSGEAFNPIVPHAVGCALLPPAESQDVIFEGTRSLPCPLACGLNSWLSGAVLVHSNPYFTVSESDGSFSLKYLPTGVPLTIQVWHESAGYLAAKPGWTNGRFIVTLDADQDLGLIRIPRTMFK